MGLQAQLYPFHYVNRLRSLVVPGYTGYPGGVVAITRYVSANTLFGGANLASVLRQALATAGTAADRGTLADAGVGRVFTGQGMPDDFVTVLSMVDQAGGAAGEECHPGAVLQTDRLLAGDAGCFGAGAGLHWVCRHLSGNGGD